MSMTDRPLEAAREYRSAREAAEELRRLVADDPENVSALTNLGVVLLQQGKGRDAWTAASEPGAGGDRRQMKRAV